MQTVGLSIIARDEEKTLPVLLQSLELTGEGSRPAVDQVVLCDTGSTDRTVEVFEEWAGAMVWPDVGFEPFKVVRFEWVDDFAAARNFADSHLDTTWASWADCDDTIKNPEALRALAGQATPQVGSFIVGYDYAQLPDGTCVCYLKRERLTRRSMSKGWQCRVHESQMFEGVAVTIPANVCEWVHHKGNILGEDGTLLAPDRNLRILRRWVKDEPDNPFVLAYLGMEQGARGQHKQAMRWFRRYLRVVRDQAWDEHRAQVYRKLCVTHFALGEPGKAVPLALEAIELLPTWPDSYLTLAEAYFQQGQWAKAGEWAKRVIEIGPPDTMLIVNPLDYTFQPRCVLAGALAELGQLEDALTVGQEARELQPHHPELARQLMGWRDRMKREHAANTFHGMAAMLVEHDEQLKALALLEDCVPYFATDHAKIVALRAQLRHRLAFLSDPAGYADHYEHGGSKVEDFVSDENVDAVCESLPRAGFLLQGIRDRIAA